MAAVEQHIEYELELHAGEIVSVSSPIADGRDKALRMVHEMRNDETGLRAARTTIVILNTPYRALFADRCGTFVGQILASTA